MTVITPTNDNGANSTMNQSEFLAIAYNLLKGGKNRAHKLQLVLVLLPIG